MNGPGSPAVSTPAGGSENDVSAAFAAITDGDLYTGPAVLPIRGYLRADELLHDDYVHDGLQPGRVLRRTDHPDGHVHVRCYSPLFGERGWTTPADTVFDVTRLVTDELEPA